MTTLGDRLRAYRADEERDRTEPAPRAVSDALGAPQTGELPKDDPEHNRARAWLLQWAGDRWTPKGLPALPGMGIGTTGDDWSAFLLGADLGALQRARAEAEALQTQPVPLPQTAEEWEGFCRIYGGEPPEQPASAVPTAPSLGPMFEGQEGGV